MQELFVLYNNVDGSERSRVPLPAKYHNKIKKHLHTLDRKVGYLSGPSVIPSVWIGGEGIRLFGRWEPRIASVDVVNVGIGDNLYEETFSLSFLYTTPEDFLAATLVSDLRAPQKNIFYQGMVSVASHATFPGQRDFVDCVKNYAIDILGWSRSGYSK